MTIHLAIVGCRYIPPAITYEMFRWAVDAYIMKIGRPATIISGGANGIDSWAAKYANDNSFQLIEYRPNWKLGRKAGPIRNSQIVAASTHVLAFPSHDSVGTIDTINKARHLVVKIIPVEQLV